MECYLKHFRVKNKLTQTELGQLCGLSQNSISSIENGNCNCSIKTALLLACVLDCSVEDLFKLNDPYVFCKFSDLVN